MSGGNRCPYRSSTLRSPGDTAQGIDGPGGITRMDDSTFSTTEAYFEALCREMEADAQDVPAVWTDAS